MKACKAAMDPALLKFPSSLKKFKSDKKESEEKLICQSSQNFTVIEMFTLAFPPFSTKFSTASVSPFLTVMCNSVFS